MVETRASIGCCEHASLEHDVMREGVILDFIACEDDKHARGLVVANGLDAVEGRSCRVGSI